MSALGITNFSLAKAAKVRKTLLLIGEYSPDGPTLSLFTNSTQPDAYLNLFDAIGRLTYDDFSRIIKPKIGMYRMPLTDRFTPLVYEVPDARKPAVSLTHLAPDDPLFLQGMAYTNRTRADAEHEEAGRAFFRKLVAGLDAFSNARTHHAGLVLLLAKLLERCASQHGLPAYPYGGPLPPGLPEAFIDLLYADDRAKFSPESLDLESGIWKTLTKNKTGRDTLANVVSAMRDVILAVGKEQFNGIVFSGGSLSALAKEVVRGQETLLGKFRTGRSGRQFVTDTLRSPPRMGQMLMMVLRAAYERVEKVRGAFQDQHEADTHVEAEICSTSGEVLAAAVKRPDGEQRRVFAAEIKSGFRALILAVVADDKEAEAEIGKLSKPLQELARSIRADAGRRKMIIAISGAASGAEMTQAFVQAVQMVIGDTLLPALYRSPVLDARDVKQQLRSALMSLYLTSVLMSDKNDAAIKEIAVKRLSAFEEHIDKIGKPGEETQQVVKLLLDDVLGALARPEAAEQLTEGIRVLGEALAMFDAAELDKDENLFYALREKLEGKKTNANARTARSHKRLNRRVAELVTVAVRNKAVAHHAASTTPGEKKKGASRDEPGKKKGASPEEVGTTPTQSEHLKKIDDLVAAVMPGSVPAAEQPAVVAAVVEKAMADERFVAGLDRDLEAFDGIAWLIFSRYADPRNAGKVDFRRAVQRLSLLDIILQDQAHLELGRTDSWMYQLLLDMVEAIGEGLDPAEFVRTKSLTLYFDNETLAEGGVSALRQSLELMGEQSRKNLAGLIGELYGVKHLLDSLAEDAEVEVIVFNGTASAFLHWLKKDSLTPNEGKGLMRLGGLLTSAENRRIVPGVILLSGGDVEAFLAALKVMKLSNSGFAVVLPPVIASTGPQSCEYVSEGMQMVAAAAQGPAALTVVGPGIQLNPADSPFPTHIPAGYTLAAHFLGQPEQGLCQENVARLTEGRFHAVGYGTVGLKTSLEQVLWGEASLPVAGDAAVAPDDSEAIADGDDAGHFLEADLFAYLMLQAAGGVAYSGDNVALDAEAFYARFYSKTEDPASRTYFTNEIACLGPALHGNDALRMCFDSNLAGNRNTPPTLTIADLSGPNLASSNAKRRTMRDLAWIPAARKAAQLPWLDFFALAHVAPWVCLLDLTMELTMAMTATFAPTNFTNVVGYLGSVCFTPTQGFQGQWWMYIHDKVDAQQKQTPMNLGAAGPATVGTLLIDGESRSYQLPNITLQSVEPGATRRVRFRTAEFSYPHIPNVAQSIPATFRNTGTRVLQPGALGNDYEWGLDTFPQHLLGFQARLSPADSVVVRFASLRNAKNSIFERVVQLNNAQAADANHAMPAMNINFAQKNLSLTKDNIVHLFVQELYGECCKWPTPTLSDYLAPGAGPSLARLNPPSYTADQLISHEVERGFDTTAKSFTVEVCTIVFVPGYYRDLLIG